MKDSVSDSLSSSLLVDLQKGEGEAWGRFVRIFTPLVYSWCRRQNLTPQDCLDIVQDVFQSVHRALPRFQYSRGIGSFRGWLSTITRNKILDHRRKSQGQPTGVGGSEFAQAIANASQSAQAIVLGREEGLEATWSSSSPILNDHRVDNREGDTAQFEDANDRNQLVRRAAQQIRDEFEPKTWEMFWQTAVDGKLPADVAAIHGVQITAVYKAKSRVLKRLRTVLDGILDT